MCQQRAVLSDALHRAFFRSFFNSFFWPFLFFWQAWQEKSTVLLWLGATRKMKTRETFTGGLSHPKKIIFCSDLEPQICLGAGISMVPFIGSPRPLLGRDPCCMGRWHGQGAVTAALGNLLLKQGGTAVRSCWSRHGASPDV